MRDSFALEAIDGANPLGYLSALGTLRLASLRWPGADVALGWVRSAQWIPTLYGAPLDDQLALCSALLEAPSAPLEVFAEMLGKNITVSPDTFRLFALFAHDSASLADRRTADFAGAFGCEDCPEEKNDRIRRTQLCFITGSGHQDFLGTMTGLKTDVGVSHIYEALFGGWQGLNKGLAFRWDPGDAQEYALRWGDPSKGGAWTTWGANRLAMEALPFFPAQPQSAQLVTTGFTARWRKGEKRKDQFTWPIWTHPLSCDEVRSLLGLTELQAEAPDREHLQAQGIQEMFRATRVRIGQGANFKVSFRPARTV